VKSEESILKFFGCQLQDPDLLGDLKSYGVIIDLLGPCPYLCDNGRRVLTKFAQPRACEPCDSSGGTWYRVKPRALAGGHEIADLGLFVVPCGSKIK
jgi:hypothetical protein